MPVQDLLHPFSPSTIFHRPDLTPSLLNFTSLETMLLITFHPHSSCTHLIIYTNPTSPPLLLLSSPDPTSSFIQIPSPNYSFSVLLVSLYHVIRPQLNVYAGPPSSLLFLSSSYLYFSASNIPHQQFSSFTLLVLVPLPNLSSSFLFVHLLCSYPHFCLTRHFRYYL
jgi:hypothetical protein